RDDILRRAGIAAGENVFRIGVADAERRIVKSPWIAEARVERRLPDGVAIAVVERRPAGLAEVERRLSLVDATGRPFTPAAIERGEGQGLVVISGLDRRAFRDGGPAAGLVRLGLRVAADWAVDPAGTRPPLGEVHLARNGITLYTLQGAT